jgi:processive 1,2-diacylglycerol beta-glucosyltransferase
VALGEGVDSPEGLNALVDWLPDHHRATLAMRPEVMVLAARYGDGHLRAAKGITQALLAHWPQIRVGLLDYYGFVNPRLDAFIRWSYMTSVRYVPAGWRFFYRSTHHIDPRGRTQALLNRIGIERFYEAIRSSPPEVVVSTYPTAAGVVATLKRQGRLQVSNLVVMTDYDVHSQWIHDGVDLYFVGCEDMVDDLAARGIDRSRIEVTGIPVDDRFREPVDRMAVLEALGLPDQPTLLCMGGSYLPPRGFERLLAALGRVRAPHNLIIVAGRAPGRLEAAQAFRAQSRQPVAALGYVNNVHELMGAASLLISKAGGLTVTEALCRGLPQIVFRPIPGQEEANTAFLTRQGAAVYAPDESRLVDAVEQLLANPLELAQMARRSRQLGRPHATAHIARRIAETLERQRLNATS